MCEKFDVNDGQEIEEHKKVTIHENEKKEINKYENNFVHLGYQNNTFLKNLMDLYSRDLILGMKNTSICNLLNF